MGKLNFTRYICDRCGTTEDVQSGAEPVQVWMWRKTMDVPDEVINDWLFCEVCDASFLENADDFNKPFNDWLNEGRTNGVQ